MLILFVVNIPEFFISHRLQLAIAARDAGFDVHVATGKGKKINEIIEHGFRHHLIPLTRSSYNPITEIRSILAIYILMCKLRPNLVHLVTIKPLLYGCIAARLSNVPSVVGAISGMGTIFSTSNAKILWIKYFMRFFYKLALAHPNIKIIFQNSDDLSLVVGFGAISDKNAVLIKGSGVSLDDYSVSPLPDGQPIVSFIARLLKDKGVKEFIDAAKLLQKRSISAKFWLIGDQDPENLTSVTNDEILNWNKSRSVCLLGHRNNIAELISNSHIIVLPSYREGMPKVLMEAAACGRAVITTDVPGCRDAIQEGETGLLVPAKDSSALADAIQFLISNPAICKQMGISGRKLAEKEFDIKNIVQAHLVIYSELISKCMHK